MWVIIALKRSGSGHSQPNDKTSFYPLCHLQMPGAFSSISLVVQIVTDHHEAFRGSH